ncbi:peptidylprolyl isomerase [Plantibacter sp. YIM 135249]|uniref:peptidylprolyl isomerase n=1 Tax=Plantibacter sp. YIM 135249 TaxID=3423918 RepID=UPI003D33F078
MATSKGPDKEAREARARIRGYNARRTVHEQRSKRRVRDNIIATVALVVVIGAATIAQVFYFSGGPGTPVATPSASASAPANAEGCGTNGPADGSNTGDVPPTSLAEGRDWTGTMTINDIALDLQLDGACAPQGVSSFIALAKSGFYDGVTCHRLTTSGIYVLQCGDPKGDGTGGPGYNYGPVENAPAGDVYPAGTIAMARQGGNGYSNGSQFFIVYQDSTIPSDAAGGYTILGNVTDGLDQLISGVTSAGVSGGGGDGAPSVPAKITSVTVQ